MLGWSDARLKLGIQSFDPPEFGLDSKSEGVFEQFTMDDLSLDTGDDLTKSNLKFNIFLLAIGMFLMLYVRI